MPWKHAVIMMLALAAASCSKTTEDETSTEAEWPKNGLSETQANQALAKVAERTISVGEFADRLASQSPYLRARFESPERRKEFLDNIVRFELLVYEAKRRGYADKPEIIRARRSAMIQQLVKQEVDQPLDESEISDEEIKVAYDSNPDEFNRSAQVRAGHIFIKDRAKAEKLLAKAKATDISGFRKMARDESEDEKTKGDSGDLQFFEAEGDGPPPARIRTAAFSLDKVGAVYPKLVEEGGGYHIIMLTGKRAALTRTYEQAKRAIRHKLTRERKDAAMEALTERLRKEIEVEIDYQALEAVQIDEPDLPKRR